MAVFDMNEESGEQLAKKLSPSAKFFECNVLESESITAAVKGAAEWATQTGKPLGGVIPAAGVSTPATVCALCACVCWGGLELTTAL